MPIPIRIDHNDPAATLASISQLEQQRYSTDYAPVEDKVIASLDDRSITDRAQERADLGFQGAKGRAQRDRRRYGIRTSAVDKQENDAAFSVAKASTGADTVNNSFLDQFERNRTVRNELINIGRGVSGDASSGFASASAMQTQRENTNRQVKAQNKAANINAAGSFASTALMLALV